MTQLLVADIGGTKIDFAVLDGRGQGFRPLMQGTLASGDFDSCAAALQACLGKAPGGIDYVSLAVAGPVRKQQVAFTNLPWLADAATLEEQLGVQGVVLTNDLAALAHGLELLETADLEVLKAGQPQENTARLAIAAGTGLGAALAVGLEDGGGVRPTEAGHMSFMPRNALERDLLSFLSERQGHVSMEMVCSGRGMENIFAFLVEHGMAVPQELAGKGLGSGLLTPLITSRALDQTIACPISRRCCEIFFDLLAEFCGNLAVTLLPAGGIFLGGGMVQRLAAVLDKERFIGRFHDRGQMTGLVAGYGLQLITHDHAPLLGACKVGRQSFYDAE